MGTGNYDMTQHTTDITGKRTMLDLHRGCHCCLDVRGDFSKVKNVCGLVRICHGRRGADLVVREGKGQQVSCSVESARRTGLVASI